VEVRQFREEEEERKKEKKGKQRRKSFSQRPPIKPGTKRYDVSVLDSDFFSFLFFPSLSLGLGVQYRRVLAAIAPFDIDTVIEEGNIWAFVAQPRRGWFMCDTV